MCESALRISAAFDLLTLVIGPFAGKVPPRDSNAHPLQSLGFRGRYSGQLHGGSCLCSIVDAESRHARSWRGLVNVGYIPFTGKIRSSFDRPAASRLRLRRTRWAAAEVSGMISATGFDAGKNASKNNRAGRSQRSITASSMGRSSGGDRNGEKDARNCRWALSGRIRGGWNGAQRIRLFGIDAPVWACRRR
jgi:hypothetical protein